MKFKYVFIVCLILAILMIGAVNATDTISEDVVSNEDDTPLEITDNNVYMAGENSFSNLDDEIKNTSKSLATIHICIFCLHDLHDSLDLSWCFRGAFVVNDKL